MCTKSKPNFTGSTTAQLIIKTLRPPKDASALYTRSTPRSVGSASSSHFRSTLFLHLFHSQNPPTLLLLVLRFHIGGSTLLNRSVIPFILPSLLPVNQPLPHPTALRYLVSFFLPNIFTIQSQLPPPPSSAFWLQPQLKTHLQKPRNKGKISDTTDSSSDTREAITDRYSKVHFPYAHLKPWSDTSDTSIRTTDAQKTME